jgi:hypothetical protein
MFARRIDAALAGEDEAVPPALRDAAARTLAQLEFPPPRSGPQSKLPIRAQSLRKIYDGLDAAVSRTNDRLASAYRAQGMTASELVHAIALEYDLQGVEAALRVAAAVDAAAALLTRTWKPADLRCALERELSPEVAPLGEMPRAPEIVAFEGDRPLPGRKRHFSASSLNLYADCARKWYFKYLCAAVEDKPTSASAYGTAFHAALEAFHKVYPSIDGASPEELGLRLEGEINTAFETHRAKFGSEVEFRLNRRRAQRTARKYLSWLRERATKEPFDVVGCELSADLSLEGFEFRGYIDRIDRDRRSGRVTVFDYKTGAIATSAAEYRQKINDGYEFQLPYYYWAQTMAGETVRSLALIPLRDAHLDVDPIELEIVPIAVPPGRGNREATRGVISVDELERARTAMVDICRTLSSGAIERFPPTADPASCRYCVYAPACREKPFDDERPFAR